MLTCRVYVCECTLCICAYFTFYISCFSFFPSASDGRDDMFILSAAAETIWTCPECSPAASRAENILTPSLFALTEFPVVARLPNPPTTPAGAADKDPRSCPSALPDKKLKTQSSSVGMRLIKGAFIRFNAAAVIGHSQYI